MGGKNETTKTTNKPNPVAMEAYKNVLGKAQRVASTPYKSYTDPRVAGFTGDQEAAFEAIRNAQGIWAPYLNTASQYAQQGAQGTTGDLQEFNSENLAQYQNPYTKNVIDATMANIARSNAIQQNDLVGRAISSGSSPFGGDRAGIAAAELARNQDLASNQVMAGLQSDAYNSAVSQFNTQNQAKQQALQADRAAAAGAANQYAGLGTTAQNAALTGAGGLMTAGAAQQALGQQQLDVPYQDYLNRQAYPFQTTGWLAGIASGLGSQMGGTSTTTQPGPSLGNQLLGAGTAALGVFSDERIKEDISPVGRLDNGQTVYSYRFKGEPNTQIGLLAQEVEETHPEAVGNVGGIKTVDYSVATRAEGGPVVFDPTTANVLGITSPSLSGSGIASPAAPTASGQSQNQGLSSEAIGSFAKALKGGIDAFTSFNGGNQPGYFGSTGYVNSLPFGGPRACGGAVNSYADGGIVAPMINPSTFSYKPSGIAATNSNYGTPYLNALPQVRFDPTPTAPAPTQQKFNPADIFKILSNRSVRNPVSRIGLSQRAEGGAIGPYGEENDPLDAEWLNKLAPEDSSSQPSLPPSSYASTQSTPIAPIPTPAPESGKSIPSGWGILSGEDPNTALIAAGAAMMASRSPHVGTAIGEGILAGLNQYQSEKRYASQLDARPTLDTSGPTTRVYYPSEKKWVDTGIPNYKYQTAQKELKSGPKTSLSPIYGTKDGKTVLLQARDDGTLAESTLPEGVTISSGIEKTDLGSKWMLTDRRSGQLIGYEDKDLAGQAAELAKGKAKGESASSLPSDISSANFALDTINDLRYHPSREASTGLSKWFLDRPFISTMSGVKDFMALNNQAKGQVFLQAIQALKGTGALSEAEGSKAEVSVARLDPEQSEEGYLKALDDLETYIKTAVNVSKEKSGIKDKNIPSEKIKPSSNRDNIPSVSDRSDIEALPPGSFFRWTDGKIYPRK